MITSFLIDKASRGDVELPYGPDVCVGGERLKHEDNGSLTRKNSLSYLARLGAKN